MHISGVPRPVHDAAKTFCQQRGLRLGKWVTDVIHAELKRIQQAEYEAEQARLRHERIACEREYLLACDEPEPIDNDLPSEITGPPFWEREGRV